jgi:NAD(P)-dependent dehydrogenase (short-subunit alcohol dehydrogenase family)
MTTAQRVWLITGTSQGFGKELVKAVLERGDSVIATSRTPQKILDEFGKNEKRLLAVSLDLSNPAQITSVVKQAIDTFGRIDVLVNNAGHGLLGAIEETNDSELLKLFETNVFGLLRVTRAVLPYMRAQKEGRIVNIASLGGMIGVPGWGAYSATKFAVIGLSEALALEVASFGIKVTAVAPGPFGTNFLGNTLKTETTLAEYSEAPGLMKAGASDRYGKQLGDPASGAEAIIEAVSSPQPPQHLLLGSFAYQFANKKLDELRKEFEQWKDVTNSSDAQPEKGEAALSAFLNK